MKTEENREKKIMKMSAFRSGERGRIVEIQSSELQLAMLSYGVLPGEIFLFSEVAPLGDPIAIRIEGTKVALRKAQAELILAEVVE